MAEEESSQEKTEEPTSKKLEKAREEGQTPRSKELNTLAVLLGGSIGLFVFGNVFYEAGRDLFAFNFSIERVDGFDETRMLAHIAKSARIGMFVLLPFFAVMLIASLIGPLSLGGWLLSTKVIAPKFSRLDPLAGIKRMFSVNSLVELGKSVAKVLVVSAVAIATLYFSVPGLRMLGMQDVQVAIDSATVIIMTAFFLMSLSILLIAAIDVPFQIVQHVNKLKMSMQEVKDEMKNTEGKPEVKSRIRQVQQEMSRGRMMSAVPDADVIITNPTHFAVALKYDPANMATPVVVARGVDNMAMLIRELGSANDVAVVSYPMLARAVYYTTELDQPIPEGLYMAVAQVLAYVFQLRQYRKGAAPRPVQPASLRIPGEYQDIANRGRK